MAGYLIAADQGTTSSRAVLFDENCRVVDIVQREFRQYYPKEGWVEHDPMEIYASQYGAINEVIAKNGVDPRAVRALGITNQRETAIVWDRETGLPVYNAIVWQCRRTAPICEELTNRGLSGYIKDVTGLVIDAYFSATKIKWILDNADGARRKAEEGRLMFGTVDSWLIYNMTGKSVHVTDRTNASRTMLYDIHNLCWSERLCGELGIPMSMLPEVKSSSEVYGYFNVSGVDIPIAGIAGDQQSALFGHQCFSAGSAKNTYGTGCFLLMNTGEKAAESRHGLITTIAATPKDSVQYALEGSVFTAGAVVQWMRDELELIKSAEETEALAMSVPDTGGVYLVPAFTGLGAPDWDMYARGTIVGLTRGTNKRHLARAGLESIAYQSDAVIRAMELDVGQRILALNVDGGASQNNFLMQFQSDISGLSIHRSNTPETTALGAVYLAGLAAGVFKDVGELEGLKKNGVSFTPQMPENERNARRREYARAAERAAKWIVPEQ